MHAPISRVLAAAALATAAGLAAAPAAAVAPAVARPVAAATPPAHLTVGSLTLHRCFLAGGATAAYCGSVQAPLDYRSKADGTIKVGFGWLPATKPAAHPRTLVAEEGGPGYPSTVTVTGPGGESLCVHLHWHNASATLVADGHHLHAPAP